MEDDAQTLSKIKAVATVSVMEKQYPTAEILLKQAYELALQVYGEDHIATIDVLMMQAVMYGNWEKPDLAEKMLEKALEYRQKVLGDNDPFRVTILKMLADARFKQEKYAETLSVLRSIVDHMGDTVEKEGHYLLSTTNNLHLGLTLEDNIEKALEAQLFGLELELKMKNLKEAKSKKKEKPNS